MAAEGFAAVLLVCLAPVPPDRCDESTAVEIRSIVVDNELGCAVGWQELIARAAAPPADPGGSYLKTACRRVRPTVPAPRPTDPAE